MTWSICQNDIIQQCKYLYLEAKIFEYLTSFSFEVYIYSALQNLIHVVFPFLELMWLVFFCWIYVDISETLWCDCYTMDHIHLDLGAYFWATSLAMVNQLYFPSFLVLYTLFYVFKLYFHVFLFYFVYFFVFLVTFYL